MSWARVLYIGSLIILGILLVFTIFRPVTSDEKRGEVQQEQLLETKDGWIIEFNIINRDGKDTEFTVDICVDGEMNTEKVMVPNGGAFTYIYDVYRRRLTDGEVILSVCKQGEADPIEQITYYLK